MDTVITLSVIFIIVIGAAIWFWKFADWAIRAPAVRQLSHDDEYRNATPQRQREMEGEMMAYLNTGRDICGDGDIVFPGEEILALEGKLDYFQYCEDEEQCQRNLDELPKFIGPAQEYLEKLRTMEPENGEQAEELQSQIEDGEGYLAEAADIIANPQDILARWREDLE